MRTRIGLACRRRLTAVCAVGTVVTLVAPLGASSATAPSGPLRSNQQAPAGVSRAQSAVPLGDGRLREAVERLGSGRPAPTGIKVRGDKVLVEILLSGAAADVRQTVKGLGGDVHGEVGNTLLEAYVPYGRLVALERAQGVRSLRPPLRVDEPVGASRANAPLALIQGDEVAKTNAAAWHAAGFQGAGVKVGIVDSFDSAKWNAAQAAGEVPAPAGTFCQLNGDNTCDVFGSGSSHGEGVAEIVHEMAPDAQLYIASARSLGDLQSAVSYFSDHGVMIVSRSLTSEYDGPGDGIGPMGTVVGNAVSHGMTWFNSAGNNAGLAGPSGFPGSYWRGPWSDPDADSILDFGPGDEALAFTCGFVNGFRWNDWVTLKTDYDAWVYDDPGLTQLESASVRNQATPGVDPIELPSCSTEGNPNDVDYLVVTKYDNGNGTNGDVLEFMTNGTALEYWQNAYSAAAPAVDLNNAGAIAVGAIDPAGGTAIAPYSSQGPTNDARIKPDLSAASCVASFTYAPNCFNGTSAATPVAAGAAALVKGAGLAATPAQVRSWLMTNAIVDRGVVGSDNVFGAGELILPPPATVPGAPTNVTAAAGDVSATVSWTAPTSNGGSALTGYVVTPYVGSTPQASAAVGNVTSKLITGLTNGIAYTFTVKALNWVGSGPESAASNVVTPSQPPAAINWAANPSVDFDGDHMTDLGAMYRGRSPLDSLWFALSSGGGAPFQIYFGATSDVPVPGDYDGDGKTDAVIFRPATGLWYGPRTGAAQIVIQMVLGQAGDIPIPGDYDGDGKTDPAIYRPATGLFFAILSGGGVKSSTFGLPTDVPVPRDYDADGKTDFAIYRQNATPDHLGLWYSPLSNGGVYQIYFGAPGDVPVPGDYNGDKRAEAVIFREATGLWYGPFNGAPGLFQLLLGGPGDVPIPGYYDNNLTMDPGTYHKANGNWFALKSGGGVAQVNGLGLPADVPVQKRPALAGGI